MELAALVEATTRGKRGNKKKRGKGKGNMEIMKVTFEWERDSNLVSIILTKTSLEAETVQKKECL